MEGSPDVVDRGVVAVCMNKSCIVEVPGKQHADKTSDILTGRGDRKKSSLSMFLRASVSGSARDFIRGTRR